MKPSKVIPVILIVTCGSACHAVKRPAVPSEFSTGMNLAVQGSVRAALSHLRQVPPDALKAGDREALGCMLARFDSKAPAPAPSGLDEWTANVLRAYQRYWSREMLATGPGANRAGERELAKALAPLAGAGTPEGAPPEMDALEPLLAQKLEARGYHALFGVTTPLREFMLWRAQTDETYDVALPGGRESVHVVMLDGFVSLGWVGFATCGYYHSGGWTKPDRLYCVRSSYDLASEAFRVSYLAHEGQHFADSRQLPQLEQPELEYRAKLVEIVNANTSLHDLLREFSGNVSDSREQPHAFANRRLMTDLTRALTAGPPSDGSWWEKVPSATIRSAAARLFEEDTRHLRAASDSRTSR